MTDYLIIGGGLIGMFTARYLSESGAQVALIERGRFGQESSWAGGGILSPLYPWKYPEAVSTLATWSQAQYPQLADELQQSTGIDVEWIQSGLLMLDADQIASAIAWAERTDTPLQAALSNKAIQAIEMAVAPGHDAAIWMPNVAQIRNPLLIQVLRKDLENRGVRLAENTEVTHLLTKKNRIQGVCTDYTEIMAPQVIITCGAWSATLLRELGDELPVVPVRGQMLLYRAQPGQLRRIVLSEGHYAIPRRDGRILVGSTLEEVGFDKTITEEARDDLATAARTLLPMLADIPIERHWAGLRPGSPTGVPFIGAHPRVDGLFINAGHYRNGVAMGPASARLLADILLDRPPAVEPRPYALVGRASAA